MKANTGAFSNDIALLAWSDPDHLHADVPCTLYFDDMQWKALYCFRHKTRTPPSEPPPLGDVVRWIAKLGGYLGRNSDPPPGTQVLWKGLEKFDVIVETVGVFTNFGADPPRPP